MDEGDFALEITATSKENNNVIKLGKVYSIESLNFEWINEDTLYITYKYIDRLQDEMKFNAQSIIKLENKGDNSK